MPWNVTFNAAHGTVELLLNGIVTPKDLEESAAVACAQAGEKGVMHFLIDLCQVTEFTSLAQLYELPAKRYSQMGVDRLARAAVVPAQDVESRKAAQFYEDACRNRGWNVRLFIERQRALEWLSGTGEVEERRRFRMA
jgi:hypothetical protein